MLCSSYKAIDRRSFIHPFTLLPSASLLSPTKYLPVSTTDTIHQSYRPSLAVGFPTHCLSIYPPHLPKPYRRPLCGSFSGWRAVFFFLFFFFLAISSYGAGPLRPAFHMSGMCVPRADNCVLQILSSVSVMTLLLEPQCNSI